MTRLKRQNRVPTAGWVTSAAFLLNLIAAPLPATSATIELSHAEGCALELSGTITAGDARRLALSAGIAGLTGEIESGEPKNSVDDALCLDSPGGSYQEGRDMAQFVHQHGIATRVRRDAERYSSCAFLFMAGRSLGAEVDGPRRILSIGGQLGFHAPYLALEPQAAFSGTETSALATLSLQLIADFIRFSSYTSSFDHRPMFSMSLLEQTLRAGPDQLSLVDTVEEVARWSIELEGAHEIVQLGERHLVQACANFQAWSFDQPSEAVTDFSWYLPLERSTARLWGKETQFGLVDTGGMEVRNCLVEIRNEPAEGFAICSRDEFNGVLLGDCENGLAHWWPWYYAMPPSTPLTDLR